mmetsp:Transcript_20235/g.47235  ORF Transcript_20235/g.47235 Transcript_20235/m.47235 type:complete len:214 (-) Transcript_20235:164-805(-)
MRALQNVLSFRSAAFEHEPSRRLWHNKQGQDEKHQWQHQANTEHHAPIAIRGQSNKHQVGNEAEQDAHIDGELRPRRQGTAVICRSKLSYVHRVDGQTNSNADTEEAAAHHQPTVVRRCCRHPHAQDEEELRGREGPTSAEVVCQPRREQGSSCGYEGQGPHVEANLPAGQVPLLLHQHRHTGVHTNVITQVDGVQRCACYNRICVERRTAAN